MPGACSATTSHAAAVPGTLLRTPCSHMNGLALALLLGVDGAILPPAVCRATFNTTLEHLRDDTLWSPQPLGTLLDVRKMQSYWREQHSIELQEVRACAGHRIL